MKSNCKSGGSLAITGMVSNIISKEYIIEITVIDPNNDEILNEEVDLDSDGLGFFEFDFDLANDGFLGGMQ